LGAAFFWDASAAGAVAVASVSVIFDGIALYCCCVVVRFYFGKMMKTRIASKHAAAARFVRFILSNAKQHDRRALL